MPTEISGSTGVNKIQDNTIVNADINSSAAIAGSKISGGVGKVLQTVQGTSSTAFTSTSTSYADIGLSVAITPSSTSSKILVMTSCVAYVASSNGAWIGVKLLRGSTELINNQRFYERNGSDLSQILAYNYLDSPSTTSSTTYKLQGANTGGSGNTKFIHDLQGAGTATIIAMEIAG